MTSPSSFEGDWVWITHPDLGDSPNPVRREAAKHYEKAGWSVTDAPGSRSEDEDAAVPADTSPGEPAPASRRGRTNADTESPASTPAAS